MKDAVRSGFAAALALAWGCAGATTGTSGATSSDGGSAVGSSTSCSGLANAARQEVDAVIESHRSCTQASDCVSVGLSASCFDSCSRSARADSEAARKAAKDKVDKAQCAQFVAQGCKLIIPPCAPPREVACVNGACVN